MSGFRFTPAAKRHLLDIWNYPADRWGDEQADKYLQAIDRAVADVASGGRLAQPCARFGARLQRVLSGSHAVYLRYKEASDHYSIIGVLHQQMDPPRHLTEGGGK